MTFRNLALATTMTLGTLLGSTAVNAETLTFVSWMKDEKGYGDWWNEVIARFEADHPGVTVEMTKVARAEYADTMFTMFAGGNPPDIVHLAAFEYQPFADAGWMEDLGPWFQKANFDLTGWAGQGTCEWKGQTYCLMLLYTSYILAYNDKLLADAGAELPTDWDSFLDAARKATKDTNGDGVTDVYGVALDTTIGTTSMGDMLNFVLDAGGAWTKEGKPTFDSPGVIEGLSRWKTLVTEGLTPNNTGSNDLRQLMTEGRIAMRLDGPWIYNNTRKAGPDVIDHLKLTQSPLNPPVGGTSNVIGMPASLSPEKKDLVWDFIMTAGSPEMQDRFATLGSSPAPRPGLDYTEQAKTVPYFELYAAANKRAADAGIDRMPKGLELEYNQVAKVVGEEVQRMIIDDIAPEETAKTIQKRVEELIAG
jgi:multiple sugar transport system substrate-binding protein